MFADMHRFSEWMNWFLSTVTVFFLVFITLLNDILRINSKFWASVWWNTLNKKHAYKTNIKGDKEDEYLKSTRTEISLPLKHGRIMPLLPSLCCSVIIICFRMSFVLINKSCEWRHFFVFCAEGVYILAK